MLRVAAMPLLLCSSVSACTASAPVSVQVDPDAQQQTRSPQVLNAAAAEAPAAGAVATTALYESPSAVTRIMRMAPGSEIPEHYHPVHDEALFVHRGTVTAVLNGQEHTVQAGDVVQIPAGTTIVGRNSGTEEAVVIVVFSGTGAGGPLTVPGRPHH